MPHTQRLKLFAIPLVLFLAMLACNSPSAADTPDIAAFVEQTQTAVALQQTLQFTPQPTEAPPQAPAPNSPEPPQPQQTAPAITQPPATSPSPTQANCTNLAKYETETIPDKTPIGPGQQFMKTWTLRNVGTCTWTPDYTLVFVKGEQMDGTSPSPIGQNIAPNATIQIFLPQTAPAVPGEHQGFWRLRAPSGQEFGLGQSGDVAFWVKILTQPGAQAPSAPQPPTSGGGINPSGPPARSSNFDNDSIGFYLGDDNDVGFAMQNGMLVMTAFTSSGDQWRVSQPSYIDNFVIEAKFQTGNACTGKDSYGLIVRAPDQPDSIIDTGYVFAFSCDGSYRVYRMDNGSFTGLKNWSINPAIKAGPKQANVMSIKAVDTSMQLYANGTLLFEAIDAAYEGGLFGLVIRSDKTLNFQVGVDQLSIWDLP